MSGVDPEVLAERAARIERHLRRVAERLPGESSDLEPETDASDAVILHLWLAVQMVVDMATSVCVKRGLGAPSSYADAFRRLGEAGDLDRDLASRLARAAGFRNVVAHAYESLDMERVHQAALHGPGDLRAFLAAMARLADGA